VLAWLPFAAVLDIPVQILLGKIAAGGIILGFAKQIGWIIILTGLRQVMWRAGLKRFSAVGA
jgi:ABC-2 type transport system permease protein